MRGDRQNHTRSPCRPVTHLLSHENFLPWQVRATVLFINEDALFINQDAVPINQEVRRQVLIRFATPNVTKYQGD